MEENMIRGAILSMQVDNNTKTKLFKYLTVSIIISLVSKGSPLII